MLMTYNRKIEVSFAKEDSLRLDGQSRILNWLYNHLLAACQDDYKNHDNARQFLVKDNLRNYMVNELKSIHPFLKTVFSSPLKEVAGRVKEAYMRLFTGQNRYPKFRSWKKKWYSLFFDEPTKGWAVEGNQLAVMFGDIPDAPRMPGKRNTGVIGTLMEELLLGEDEKIKTFRLCKQQGNRYFAVFSIERGAKAYGFQKAEKKNYKSEMAVYRKLKALAPTAKEKKLIPVPVKPNFDAPIPKGATWISLDPNHKNFFVGVDHQGKSIEWQKLKLIKYWDKKIDELKAKRDVCQKTYRVHKTVHGNRYTVHSPRWNRLNKALDHAYHCRREQLKTTLYTIAHALYNTYDVVMMGDYTPTNGTAPFDNMKRSMLNQEAIGQFRKVLKWVAIKKNKHFFVVDERNTTKDCCVCGHQEKKGTDVREFVCVSCQTSLMRDANAAVNIAKKQGFILSDEFLSELHRFSHSGTVPIGGKARINELKQTIFA